MPKRRVTYPPAKTANRPQRPGFGEPSAPRPTLATIDLRALQGRSDLAVGARVRVGGSGVYAGEAAVIEALGSGVIPSAVVRTDAGHTRRVRLIDLTPIDERSQS